MLDSFGVFSFIMCFFSEGHTFCKLSFQRRESSGILSQENVSSYIHGDCKGVIALTPITAGVLLPTAQLMCTEPPRGTKAVGFLQNVGLL